MERYFSKIYLIGNVVSLALFKAKAAPVAYLKLRKTLCIYDARCASHMHSVKRLGVYIVKVYSRLQGNGNGL